MRKVLFILAAILLLGTRGSYALNIINLEVGYDDPTPVLPGLGKYPIQPPSIWQEDHELYFDSNHSEYSISILKVR